MTDAVRQSPPWGVLESQVPAGKRYGVSSINAEYIPNDTPVILSTKLGDMPGRIYQYEGGRATLHIKVELRGDRTRFGGLNVPLHWGSWMRIHPDAERDDNGDLVEMPGLSDEDAEDVRKAIGEATNASA